MEFKYTIAGSRFQEYRLTEAGHISLGVEPRPDFFRNPDATMHAEDRNDIIVYETIMALLGQHLKGSPAVGFDQNEVDRHFQFQKVGIAIFLKSGALPVFREEAWKPVLRAQDYVSRFPRLPQR